MNDKLLMLGTLWRQQSLGFLIGFTRELNADHDAMLVGALLIKEMPLQKQRTTLS